jgi:hypothetical protein
LLTLLGDALQKTPQAGEAFEFRKQALAANPLDRALGQRAAMACFAAARRLMMDRRPADAARLLAEHRQFREQDEAGYELLRCSLLRQTNRLAEAAELETQCLAMPDGRLAAALTLHADAVLARRGAAEKKAAQQRLLQALAEAATIGEVVRLQDCFRTKFVLTGLEFTGFRTFPAKIEKLLEAIAKRGISGAELRAFLVALAATGNRKFMRKTALPLQEHYPHEARLCFLIAQSYIDDFDNGRNVDRARAQLKKARKLIGSAESDEEFLKAIEAMEAELPEAPDFQRLFGAFER